MHPDPFCEPQTQPSGSDEVHWIPPGEYTSEGGVALAHGVTLGL